MIRSASFTTPSSQPPNKQPFSFGGTASSSTQPVAPSNTGGFSFGSNTNTTPAQPSTSNNAFSFGSQTSFNSGQQQQQQNTQQQPSTGAFGQAPASNPGTTGGLFGSSTAAKPTFSFGATNTPQQQQQQQQTQQQQGGSALLNHPYYQKERFNDLTDEARNLVEEMDKMITSQVSLRDELTPQLIPSASSTSNLAPLGQSISQLYSTLQSASSSLASLSSSLESSLSSVKRLQGTVESDRSDLSILWEIGTHFKEGRGTGEAKREWLRDYFSKSASDFQSRILRYRGSMDQISRHLHSLTSRDSHSPTSIEAALHHQHVTFMGLANQVAGLHGEVEVLKRDYREWYARRFRSVRDPFEGVGEL